MLPTKCTNCVECPFQKLRVSGENKKLKGIYKRRPSGLPLVNRTISEHDVLILQTYKIKMNDKIKKAQNYSGCQVSNASSTDGNECSSRNQQKETKNGYLSTAIVV